MGSVMPKPRHSVLFNSPQLSSPTCSSIISGSRPAGLGGWDDELSGASHVFTPFERRSSALSCESLVQDFHFSSTPMAYAATENNFRSSLSQFRWARGVTDDSQAQAQAQARDAGHSRNPFSRFYNAIGGAYIPLRSSENSNEDEAYFALSRWER